MPEVVVGRFTYQGGGARAFQARPSQGQRGPHRVPRDEPAPREPRHPATRSGGPATVVECSKASPIVDAGPERRGRRGPAVGGDERAAHGRRSSCSAPSGSSCCSSSSTRSGWRSSPGPTRSRSCAWSAPPTPSCAGRSSSRARWSGSSARAVTLILFLVAADPLSNVVTRYFEVPPLALSTLTREVLVLTLGTGLGLGSVGAWLSVRRYLAR